MRVVFGQGAVSADDARRAITEAVRAVPGVQSVEVSFEDKRAVIVPTNDGLGQEAVLPVIKNLGYEATPPAQPAPSPNTDAR